MNVNEYKSRLAALEALEAGDNVTFAEWFAWFLACAGSQLAAMKNLDLGGHEDDLGMAVGQLIRYAQTGTFLENWRETAERLRIS